MSQIPISADLDTFFEPGEMAQVVNILNSNINAIITDYYEELEGGEVGIEGSFILLICKAADVVGVKHGTPVIIGLENYNVVNIRPDNSGITRLQLLRLDDSPIPDTLVTYNGLIVTYNGENITHA